MPFAHPIEDRYLDDYVERWPAPVRPGDMLSVRVTVLGSRVSKSKPDRGVVTSLVEVFNQHGELVMSIRPVNIIARRPSEQHQRHA